MGIDDQIKRMEKRIELIKKEKQLQELKAREKELKFKTSKKYRAGKAIGRGGLRAGIAIGKGIKKYVEWRAAPVKRRKKKRRSKSIFDFDF